MVFYRRHLCRSTLAPELIESFGWIEKDPTVYHHERAERVPRDRLDQETGRSRTSSARSTSRRCSPRAATTKRRPRYRDPARRIPNSEWVLFEESSHSPFLEERQRYMQVLGRGWLGTTELVI